MATAGELVDAVINRVGFDVTRDDGLALLNERYMTMAVRAELFMPTRSIGPTVAGTDEYRLDDDTAEVRTVLLDGHLVDFAPEQTLDAYAAENVTITDSGSVWAVHPKVNGALWLRLYPVPDTDGLSVEARIVARPAALSFNQPPAVPLEFHRALREGVAASLFAEDAEQASVADRLETRFDTACEELRRQTKRARRSGPARIKVQWP